MGKASEQCIECECEYFRRYNIVQKSGTDSWLPVFGLVDRRCKHPKVYTPTGKLEDNGISVEVLKKCPREM